MATPQVDQSAIDMLKHTPVDTSTPNTRQLADAISKIMPIMTRVAEIVNMHGTVIGNHDNGMKALEGSVKSGHANLVQAMQTAESMLQQQQAQIMQTQSQMTTQQSGLVQSITDMMNHMTSMGSGMG